MDNHLVSIIMPVYNTQDYLSEAVGSVISQTDPDWELLIIDDGSTDESGAICDSFAVKDKRIRVFHKENGGVSSARNEGLKRVRGAYVSFLDSDDYFSPDYLKTMREMTVRSGGLPACCGFVEMTDGKEGEPCRSMPSKTVNTDDFLYEALIGNLSLPVCCCSWIFPAEAAVKNTFDESIRFGEDTLYTCRLLSAFNQVCYDPLPLYYYRIEREGNTATEKSFMKYSSRYEALRKIRSVFDGRFPRSAQVVVKNMVENAAFATREAKRAHLTDRSKTCRSHAFSAWKELLSCPEISWKDKVRLFGYCLAPVTSEKIMLRLYGRV